MQSIDNLELLKLSFFKKYFLLEKAYIILGRIFTLLFPMLIECTLKEFESMNAFNCQI